MISMDLAQAHSMASYNDRDLRVVNGIKGAWYEDHVMDYVAKHRTDQVTITESTDRMITVRFVAPEGLE